MWSWNGYCDDSVYLEGTSSRTSSRKVVSMLPKVRNFLPRRLSIRERRQSLFRVAFASEMDLIPSPPSSRLPSRRNQRGSQRHESKPHLSVVLLYTLIRTEPVRRQYKLENVILCNSGSFPKVQLADFGQASIANRDFQSLKGA